MQGASKQGIKSHIKATKKFDNSGVGAKEAAARSQDWTLGMHTYTQVLKGLTEVTSSHAQRVDSDSDEEDAVPKAATKAEKRKSKQCDEKTSRKKQKKGNKDSNIDNTTCKQPEKEEEPPVKQVKLSSHSGRYQKREKNKRVTGYSAVDLAAILGEPAPGAFNRHATSKGLMVSLCAQRRILSLPTCWLRSLECFCLISQHIQTFR